MMFSRSLLQLMQEMWTCPSGVAVEGASGTLVAAAGIICGTFGIMHTLWGSLYEIFVLYGPLLENEMYSRGHCKRFLYHRESL